MKGALGRPSFLTDHTKLKTDRMRMTIYFDGECPFCSRFAHFQELQRNVEEVRLINLRDATADRRRLESLGFDLDKGMVLDIDGKLYPGDEAAHLLALLSTSASLLARLNRLALGTRTGSALLYPMLRLGRNASLLALGRSSFQPDNPGERAWQTLFCMAWGLFAFLHVLVYAWQYGATMWLTTWAIAPLGVSLLLFPRSRRVFLALLTCMIVDAVRQMPTLSNHTILKNTFLLALLLSGAWHALRGDKWRDFLEDAAPVGRATLCVMYFFGVFHKINTDFLNPAVSCATVLWQQMPALLSRFDTLAIHYVAIYGTLVIESVILCCLLVRRARHAGIVCGIGFHSLLAMSGYAIYAPFSTLTIALHLLFLDRENARQIVRSPFWQNLMIRLHSPSGLAIFVIWLAALAWLASIGSFGSVGVLWLPVVGLLCYAILKHGNAVPTSSGIRILWSRLWWLNSISVIFFLNCFSPYLGLKTAQSMNMFANLRLEAGFSNHLVFRSAPGPFGYLADVVEIVDSTGSTYFSRIRAQGIRVTYYDLLDKLDRNPRATVTFIRDGKLATRQSAATLQQEIQSELHPRWVRGIFHFTPVDLRSPKPCALDR
jgi:predicted DCC family thiol-disulfide oxidoreductase YuxK